MATVIYQSKTYAFATHRGGGASITRLADNASVFFQGDAASDLMRELDRAFTKYGPEEAYAQFDLSCSDYDDLMDETARNQRRINK